MAIQIDRMETSVEVTAPSAAPRPAPERTPGRGEERISPAELRDSVMQILTDELATFRRMRGH